MGWQGVFGAVSEEAQKSEGSFAGGVVAMQDGQEESGGKEKAAEDDGADQDSGQGGVVDGQASRGQDSGSKP